MKSLICATLLLCSIVLSTVFVGVNADRRLSHFQRTIEVQLPDGGSENSKRMGFEAIKDEYDDLKPFLILFVNGEDTRETERLLFELSDALSSDEANAAATAKSRLSVQVTQLRRLSIFSFESIF